jgi:hypothetical protein
VADKSLHDEVTELTAAVRELRDRELAETVKELRAEVEKLRAEVEKLRAERAGRCGCTHVHTYPGWFYPYQPYTVTYGGVSHVSNEPVSTGTLWAASVPVWGESITATQTMGASAVGSGYTVSATN